jgi:N6-L-threonylcarbamoyladenine synthase
MRSFLGIDTSNYTTSCALYNDDSTVFQQKKLLPVKEGELGLRQSDAVFHHTVQLPGLMNSLFEGFSGELSAVGVSDAPRRAQGSYMPCFLAGVNAASAVSSAAGIPLYRFSHQQGHVAAAVYSSGMRDLFKKEFIAFHVSGGTTDALLVKPDEKEIISIELLASSLDLKAGQAVDRVGVMLGFPFPAGKFVDELAMKSDRKYKINVKLKDGCCCLSGVENKCRDMFLRGEKKEDICRYCIDYIISALEKMTVYQLEKFGSLPLLFAGGVMSSKVISSHFIKKFGAYFAKPEFSADNAAGVALLASMKFNQSRG